MMEETKVTMSVARRKAITAHVNTIMKMRRGLFEHPENIDVRNEFSEYVIHHVIYGERGAINSFKGDEDRIKALAHELYLQYMQVWEDNYGTAVHSDSGSEVQEQ